MPYIVLYVAQEQSDLLYIPLCFLVHLRHQPSSLPHYFTTTPPVNNCFLPTYQVSKILPHP